MSQPYKIVGLGDVHPRLEIRDLQQNTEQFTLFIHALQEIQRPGYRPEAARFEDLAGIHGMPYQRWKGDPAAPDDPIPEGLWGGYCNHGSVLFPSWHRPYVLAVEQSVGEAAIRLARRWTQSASIDADTRKLWTDAASQLRFPFWDWTDKSGETEGLPSVLKPQVFQFVMPDGTQSSPIENPLSFYEFGNDQVPEGFQNLIWDTPLSPTDTVSYFETWTRTYRWPSSRNTPIEDYIKIDSLMRGNADTRGSVRQLRNQVGNLFCYPAPGEVDDLQRPSIYDEFSNTTFQSKGQTGWDPIGRGSIESPHNTVHLLLGGLGAMANNDYAGFDPIFYLHHCNIDRILSFWEYTYNKFWLGQGYYTKDGDGPIAFTQDGGTWVETDNSAIKEDTPLEPFRNEDGDYWTSQEARFLDDSAAYKKGYTYPDLSAQVGGETKTVSLTAPLPDTDDDVNVCKTVLQANFPIAQPDEGTVDLGDRKDGRLDAKLSLDKAIPNYRRFYVFIELVGHAFGGSYSLELLHEGQVVASFAVFSRGDRTQCAACKVRRAAGGLTRGNVDIPDDVVEKIVDANRNQILQLPPTQRHGAIAEIVRGSVTVRLVSAAGQLLADVVAPSGESRFIRGEGTGVPLDKAIVPKILLHSSRCGRKTWSAPFGREDENAAIELGFFDHADHGPIGGQDWRTA